MRLKWLTLYKLGDEYLGESWSQMEFVLKFLQGKKKERAGFSYGGGFSIPIRGVT